MEDTGKKSLKSFYDDIAHYRTDKVCEALKVNILDQVDEEDRNEVYQKLVTLRDKQVMSLLDKVIEKFPAAMLQVDLDNQNNREFIRYILDKYSKKFDKSKASVCEKLFDTACKVQHRDTILDLIRDKKAVCRYSELAKGSDEMFKLIDKIPAELMDEDMKVQILVNAALTDESAQRLKALKKKGYDPQMKNSKGQTASDTMEEYIRTFRYPKNKHGEIMKKDDLSSLKNLRKLARDEETSEEERDKKKLAILIGSILVVAVVIIIAVCVERKSDDDTNHQVTTENISDISLDTDEETGYNTDTSLVVADGDTVDIDYIGYVDGVAFEGGNTQGYGTSLTIGSGSYIDDFEEQLIGHHVGDNVEVNVTFPEDYGNEELNGKDAVFDVTINGIYE